MSLQEYCCHGTAINGELDQPCLLCEVDSLEQQVAALTEQRDRAEQQVKELLWDDPVEPSFGPAFGDLLMYLNHQTPHPTEIYQMMSNGTKLWQQMKDQVAVLTKERDELEISNAFAHGEWRAVKDQLAAMTNERNDLLILLDNWKTSQGVTEDQLAAMTTERDELLGPNPVEQMIRDQLAAAQAREAKRLKTISDEATAIAFYGDQPPQWMLNLIALPSDDSVLMERLKQEDV